MRTAAIALGLLLLVTQVYAQSGRTTLPAGPAPITYGYFDPAYARSENRQHLGVDFRAPRRTPVFAPVDGVIVTNNTSASEVMQAYLVIRTAHGVEHVLGHISSSLVVGAPVTAGQEVGRVRPWAGNSHVHWGVNRTGVAQAMQGDWGWGRAPANATRSDAARRGWVRP